ncbi:unnamed protein product [Ambrosiozyma monospora]|uniref:Unnamed protein product n=1 Tax=Ambrosiozyma monospora TaxID=43982 RepID=A0ACB5T1H5_AMBMO|nr:unnamed protein product [Ambrosiozyma monospora]
MGEQMLSREYFYLGTQLPLDRFLSFFYAHPGFHLNNVFILMSLKMFILFSINLAALVNDSVLCHYNVHIPFTDVRTPTGCYNLIPVVNWIHSCVMSIFVVFSISFIPLCVQEVTERGVWKCVTRLSKHFISFSPLFEVFVCRTYSQSLVSDMSVGNAKYVATGRGFSTTRVSFPVLFARFSVESFYFAAVLLTMLLYCSLTMWKISFLYFWVTFYALLFSPFLFNPNQFQFTEFFIDYRNLLKWFVKGNAFSKKDSWVSHVRHVRMQLTGSKKKRLGLPGDNLASNYKRPSMFAALCTQVGSRLFSCIVISIAYLFTNSQNESGIYEPSNSILRLAVLTAAPITINAAILIVFFIGSSIVGPIFTCCCSSFPDIVANVAHFLAVLNYIFIFEFFMLCQNWNFSKTLLGVCASFALQNIFFKILTIVFLSREFKQDKSNRSWWSGKWFSSHLGWHIITQPGREFICKLIEMSTFACDFIITHFILLCQFPMLFIPYIDTIHSYLLMWLSPGNTVRRPVFSPSKRRSRNKITFSYLVIYVFINVVILGLILTPIVMAKMFYVDFDAYLPEFVSAVLQPADLADNRKGLKNYHPKGA